MQAHLPSDARRVRSGVRFMAMTVALNLALAVAPAQAQDRAFAKQVYETNCAGCHASGVLNAPKFGNAADWGPRAKVGIDGLVKSATAGTAKGMPPKGGRPDLSPEQLKAVIGYMMSGGTQPADAPAKPAAAAAPAAKPATAAVPAAAPAAKVAAAAAPAPAATPAANKR